MYIAYVYACITYYLRLTIYLIYIYYVYTGNSQQIDIDTFMAAGLNKVFVKPLDVQQLIHFINNNKHY